MLAPHVAEALGELPAPWSLLHHEAVFEGKMPRDNPSPGAFQRLCLRREARQALRIKEADEAKLAFDHDPATLGPDRIGDVVLALAPDALAAWLADPNAT